MCSPSRSSLCGGAYRRSCCAGWAAVQVSVVMRHNPHCGNLICNRWWCCKWAGCTRSSLPSCSTRRWGCGASVLAFVLRRRVFFLLRLDCRPVALTLRAVTSTDCMYLFVCLAWCGCQSFLGLRRVESHSNGCRACKAFVGLVQGRRVQRLGLLDHVCGQSAHGQAERILPSAMKRPSPFLSISDVKSNWQSSQCR